MKRIFTLFLFGLLLASTAFALPQNGKISITHLGFKPVRVEIDGKDYPARNRLVMLRELSAGYHTVKIYYDDGRDNDRPGSRSSFKGNDLIYTNRVRVRAGYHVDIVINRFGKTFVDERIMDSRYDKEFDNDRYDWYGGDDRNDRDRDDRYNDRNDRNDRNNDRRNDRDDRRDDRRPMQDQAFASFLESLRKESFESTRVTLAKQVVERNYFLTAQVKQLLQIFSFESNRLDLAKYLYRNTVDRDNYFQLYDVFSFSSSKEDLANYMRTYK